MISKKPYANMKYLYKLEISLYVIKILK